jgi:hypothetical protein
MLPMMSEISILTDFSVIDPQRNYRVRSLFEAALKSAAPNDPQRCLAYRLGAAIIDNTGCHRFIDNYRCGNGDGYNGNSGSQRYQPVTSMLPIKSDNDPMLAN